MLKNIDKTNFFSFVANGFFHFLGGGGGGGTVPVDWGLVPEYFFIAGTHVPIVSTV